MAWILKVRDFICMKTRGEVVLTSKLPVSRFHAKKSCKKSKESFPSSHGRRFLKRGILLHENARRSCFNFQTARIAFSCKKIMQEIQRIRLLSEVFRY